MNLAGNKPQLSNGSRAANLANQYLSQCKLCRLGVYQHQKWHWSTNPLGIVHTDCVTP